MQSIIVFECGALMLAKFRLMHNFFKKEETIVYRYNRAYPHFKWFLALDAVLSIALVLGGVAFASQTSQTSQSSRVNQLTRVGTVAMSSIEFSNHIKVEGILAYWLGPISGYKHTYVHNSPFVISMTYWPQDSNINIMSQSKLSVATYDNLASYSNTMHPLEDPNTARLVTANGFTVRFNEGNTAQEIVTFKGRSEIVVVSYPTRQLVTILMKTAKALRPVV